MKDPVLECQDCGSVLRKLTPAEAQEVARRPYDFVAYCKPGTGCKFPRAFGGRAALDGAGGGRKHDQRVADPMMTCPSCREGNCGNCVDKVRLILRDDPICTCKKSSHADAVQGEARLKQIRDPETSDVYGPGLVVTKDGDVKRNG